MLEQMRDFGAVAFLAERQTGVVVAPMLRHGGKHSEKLTRQVRNLRGHISFHVRHFYNHLQTFLFAQYSDLMNSHGTFSPVRGLLVTA